MKIIVLTTSTTHHRYFANRINQKYPLEGIVLEDLHLKPNFKTDHSFEFERDIYEKKHFKKYNNSFENLSKTKNFKNVNDIKCLEFISKINPHIIIVFGTGIIRKPLINLCRRGIINLHGGDPQYFRGLDTHLWAIYHKLFNQLVTTLHRVNTRIDDGEIIKIAPIEINKSSEIKKLRAENTKVCVEIVLEALQYYYNFGKFSSKSQTKKGRYYSFMPAELKDICVRNFNKYIDSL